MKRYDLILGNNGAVKVWERGFFEKMQKLSMSDGEEYEILPCDNGNEYRVVVPRFKKEHNKEYQACIAYVERLNREFRNTIKGMRKELGMTQAEFSNEFHIPKRSIENWENDTREAPQYVAYLLRRLIDAENK